MVQTHDQIDVDALTTLLSVRVELPSWALRGDEPHVSVYQPPGSLRSPYELLADAAVVHRFTGIADGVGLYLPADRVDDPADLAAHAAELGMRISSVHPDLSPRAGRPPTLCHPDDKVRRRALDQLREAADVAAATRAGRMVLRLVDDGPYPGLAEATLRQQRLTEALGKVRLELDPNVLLLVDYRTSQPCTYRHDVPDWRTAQAHCRFVGPGAQVLLDLAHDPELAGLDAAAGQLFVDGRLGGLVVPGGAAVGGGPGARSSGRDDVPPHGETPFGTFVALTEVVAGGAVVPGQPLAMPMLLDPGTDRSPGILPLISAVLAVQELAARAIRFAAGRPESPAAGGVDDGPAVGGPGPDALAAVPAGPPTLALASVGATTAARAGATAGATAAVTAAAAAGAAARRPDRTAGRTGGGKAAKAARAAAKAAAEAAEAAASREAAALTEAVLLAYEADVQPLLTAARGALGVAADPVEAYHQLCQAEHREAERRAAVQRLVARRVAMLLTPGGAGRASQPA